MPCSIAQRGAAHTNHVTKGLSVIIFEILRALSTPFPFSSFPSCFLGVGFRSPHERTEERRRGRETELRGDCSSERKHLWKYQGDREKRRKREKELMSGSVHFWVGRGERWSLKGLDKAHASKEP